MNHTILIQAKALADKLADEVGANETYATVLAACIVAEAVGDLKRATDVLIDVARQISGRM